MKKEQLPWILAGLTLLAHALANPHYGFFRDELYFIICGRHPAWGYVDQPPLTPLLAAASQMFGDSLFLLRLVAALCAAATVYIGSLLVIELGGGAFAQVLAAVTIAMAPVLASFGMKQGTDMLEMPLWPLATLFVARAILRNEPKWWLGAGIALGVAFESKYSVIFFAIAVIAGLLCTAQRRELISKWFWIGVLSAIIIALPNALWQIVHGLPMLELLRNGASGKNVVLSPVDFIVQQVLIMNPVYALVWIAGLVWLLMKPPLRWAGYAFLILMVLMIASHAKNYYPAAVYPILFCAGACAIEFWTQQARWSRPIIASAAVAFGSIMIPLVLPVLPIQTYIAYQSALHITPQSGEQTKLGVLPQDYADMLGWPEMVSAVAAAYHNLPANDRAHAAIFADNYGEAAAIDFFGRSYGLPPALSGHNQYYFWGPRGFDGSVVVKVNGDAGQLRSVFRDVRRVGEISTPLVRPLEDHVPIYICRGIRIPLATVWPQTKNFI
ncbi:MAG: glycosyltransferase family 39 protein [Candidatus Eremiobacteraeota bacterium]|nr:glycosyltransferase family 39 protein [Candidatus Eremiobacteraeota bacterium]